MSVFLAIEYNWKRVGGVFSTKAKAQQWCNRQADLEPNLMWEVHPFEMDVPISDEEAVEDWQST